MTVTVCITNVAKVHSHSLRTASNSRKHLESCLTIDSFEPRACKTRTKNTNSKVPQRVHACVSRAALNTLDLWRLKLRILGVDELTKELNFKSRFKSGNCVVSLRAVQTIAHNGLPTVSLKRRSIPQNKQKNKAMPLTLSSII